MSRFSSLLWSIARGFRLDSRDAADVVQITWLRLVENLDRIEEPQTLLPLGTAGIVATTVPVNDAATVPLMSTMHTALRDGTTLAESLATAEQHTGATRGRRPRRRLGTRSTTPVRIRPHPGILDVPSRV